MSMTQESDGKVAFLTCLVFDLHEGGFYSKEWRCWRPRFVKISFQDFHLISVVSDPFSITHEHPLLLDHELRGFLVLKNKEKIILTIKILFYLSKIIFLDIYHSLSLQLLPTVFPDEVNLRK